MLRPIAACLSLILATSIGLQGAQKSKKELTEDQRIAWAKIRRANKKTNYHVVAFLPKKKEWFTWTLTARGFGWGKGFGVSFRDGIWKPTAGLKALIQSEKNWRRNLAREEKELKDLRAKAEAEVNKMGRVHLGTQAKIKRKEEQIAGINKNLKQIAADKAKEAKEAEKETIRIDGFKRSQEMAEELAGKPEVKVAVVIDLYSQEKPIAKKWFRDDGKKVTVSDKPPSKELAEGLANYIYLIQTEYATD
jgi:hypothetical protein